MEEPQFDEVEVNFSKDCVHVSVVSVRTQSDCDLDSDIHTRHQATGSDSTLPPTVTEPQKVRDSACCSTEEVEAGSSAESFLPDSTQDPVEFVDLMSLLKQALPAHYLHVDDNNDKPSPSQDHGGDNVIETQNRLADVTETRRRTADVTESQDRNTDVLETQDHTADVTETQDHTADVTETQDHTADVTKTQDHTADVAKTMDRSTDVRETQNHTADVIKSKDHTAVVIKTRDHSSDVAETQDHTDGVIKTQGDGADVAEADRAEAVSLTAVQMSKSVPDSSAHSDADEPAGVNMTMGTQAPTDSEGCCTVCAEDRVSLESASQLRDSVTVLEPGSERERESTADEAREKEEKVERERRRGAQRKNKEERTDTEGNSNEEKKRKYQLPGEEEEGEEEEYDGDEDEDDDDSIYDDNSDMEAAQSPRTAEDHLDMLMAALHGGYLDEDDIVDEMNAMGMTLESFQECEVCLETRRVSPRSCCQFHICQNCFKNYLAAKVSEGIAVNIQCPSSQCRVVLSEYEVSSHLSNNLRIKFFKFLSDARRNPTEKTCPRCGHEERVEKKMLKLKSSKRKGVEIRCKACDLQWCFMCHAPWHEGLKCKEVRKGDKEFTTWAQETSNHQANARKCPACKIYIQRAAGCFHMTCCRCSTEFCYDCGKRFFLTRTHHRVYETAVFRYLIGSHHSKLSPLGCSRNFLPNSNVARRLIRGSVLGARVIGGVIALALAAGAAVVVVTAAPVIWGVAKARRKIRNRRS